MGKICIIGLGPGDIQDITMGAMDKIRSGNKNYIRTEKHPIMEYLEKEGMTYESFDGIYMEEDSFEDVYNKIVDELISLSRNEDINYLVPGNPMVAESVVNKLIGKDANIEIISGLSFIEPMMELVGRDLIDGLQILDGLDLSLLDLDINMDTIISQVHNRRILSDIKLLLSEVYGDEYRVNFIQNAGVRGKEINREVPLYELDRIEEPNLLTSLFISRMEVEDKEIFDIKDIFRIVEVLRSKDGCPWDREQDYRSIRKELIEEAYELVDAIDKDDLDGMIEEIGDVLLQVAFHAQMGYESGEFNIYDITSKLANKLIYRHPHVFLEKTVEKSDDMVYNWDSLKYLRRKLDTYSERIKDIDNLPSLMRGSKFFKILDFKEESNDSNLVIDDLVRNLEFIKENLKEIDKLRLETLIGGILLSVVYLGNLVDIDAEVSLNMKIKAVFELVEELEESAEESIDFKEMTYEKFLAHLSK